MYLIVRHHKTQLQTRCCAYLKVVTDPERVLFLILGVSPRPIDFKHFKLNFFRFFQEKRRDYQTWSNFTISLPEDNSVNHRNFPKLLQQTMEEQCLSYGLQGNAVKLFYTQIRDKIKKSFVFYVFILKRFETTDVQESNSRGAFLVQITKLRGDKFK